MDIYTQQGNIQCRLENDLSEIEFHLSDWVIFSGDWGYDRNNNPRLNITSINRISEGSYSLISENSGDQRRNRNLHLQNDISINEILRSRAVNYQRELILATAKC